MTRQVTVSIPSQSGSLLSEHRPSAPMTSASTSQYPHSRAASCRSETPARDRRLTSGLNTLTVGQPLVGERRQVVETVSSVSIPSQSGSLLSGCRMLAQRRARRSQYPHSRAASCRASRYWTRRRHDWSQYPHSRAASCRVAVELLDRRCTIVSIPSQSGSLLSVDALRCRSCDDDGLNTLTVGQPLVGSWRHVTAARRHRSQYPHSRAASCRDVDNGIDIGID